MGWKKYVPSTSSMDLDFDDETYSKADDPVKRLKDLAIARRNEVAAKAALLEQERKAREEAYVDATSRFAAGDVEGGLSSLSKAGIEPVYNTGERRGTADAPVMTKGGEQIPEATLPPSVRRAVDFAPPQPGVEGEAPEGPQGAPGAPGGITMNRAKVENAIATQNMLLDRFFREHANTLGQPQKFENVQGPEGEPVDISISPLMAGRGGYDEKGERVFKRAKKETEAIKVGTSREVEEGGKKYYEQWNGEDWVRTTKGSPATKPDYAEEKMAEERERHLDTVRAKAEEAYDTAFSDPLTGKPLKDSPDRDEWVGKRIERITGGRIKHKGKKAAEEDLESVDVTKWSPEQKMAAQKAIIKARGEGINDRRKLAAIAHKAVQDMKK